MAITYVGSYGPGAVLGTSGAQTTSTASITCAAGDLLLVGVPTSHEKIVPASVSGGGLTWTKLVEANPSATTNFACMAWFAATSSTAQTFTATVTITDTATSEHRWTWGCQRWSGAAVGSTWTALGSTTGQTTFTTSTTNAALALGISDWNAVTGARTYVTASAGAAVETLYQQSGTALAGYLAYYANDGAAGSKTVGTSAPTGVKDSIAVVELVPGPTFVASYTDANVGTAGSHTASVTCAAGDLLLYLAWSGAGTQAPQAPTGGGLTWTLVKAGNTTNTGSNAQALVYAATASSAQTFTLTGTNSSGTAEWGFQVQRWSNAAVGSSWGVSASSTGQTTFTTTTANAALAMVISDFNGVGGGSRAFVTSSAGAYTETSYNRPTDGAYTAYSGYHANDGAAGSKTVGLSAPTGTLVAISAVELAPSPAPFQVLQRTKASTPAAATSLTVTLPGAATVGSTQVLILSTSSGSGISATPTGWTQRGSNTVQTPNTYVMEHVTTATTDTSVTVSFPSGSANAFLIEATGVIGFDTVATNTSGAGPSASYATGSLAPTAANAWRIAVSSSVTTATVTGSPVAVTDQQAVTVSGKSNLYLAYADGTTTSTSAATETFTPASSATGWETIFLDYKTTAPAAAGGVTLAGPVATATTAAPAGTVTANRVVALAGPVAPATTAAPAGTVTTGRAVVLVGPVATVTTAAPAGTVRTLGRPRDAYGALVYDASPAAYWRLDGDTTDAMGGPAPSGGTCTFTGPLVTGGTQAAAFNGSQALTWAPSTTLNVPNGTPFAMECWARLDNFAFEPVLAGSRNSGLVLGTDGRVAGYSPENFYSTTKVGLGEVHHYVLSSDGSTQTLYLDGAPVRTHVNSVTNDPGLGFAIGAWINTPNPLTEYVTGAVDEVAFYRRALTPAEVEQHYLVGSRTPVGHQPATAVLASDGRGTATVTATGGGLLLAGGTADLILTAPATRSGQRLTMPYTTGYTAAAHTSPGFDATGGAVFTIRLASGGATPACTSAETFMQLGDTSNRRVMWDMTGDGNLAAWQDATYLGGAPFTEATRWLRITLTGTTATWQYGPDGVTWTTLFTRTVTFDPANIGVSIGTGYWRTTDTIPPAAVWDSYSLTRPPVTSGAGTAELASDGRSTAELLSGTAGTAAIA